MLASGYFSPEDPELFKPIFNLLVHQGDHYMLLADYVSYVACQREVDHVYHDQEGWTGKAILNVARMGKFSSDRTIREYADVIWHAKTLRRDQA